MSLTNLIQPQGRLIDIVKKVDLGTVQHAAEIQKDRRDDESLRAMGFWTADFSLYTMERGSAVLYMATRENNLLLKNLDKAVEQLKTKNNYFPEDQDIEAVINSTSTLRTRLPDLKLKEYYNEWAYFEINTKKQDNLNKSQKALAERIHGKGNAFKKTMEMLNNSNIRTTRIYTLNPNYITDILRKNNAKSIAQGPFLGSFSGNSLFNADGRDVDCSLRRLRGVPISAAGDAQKTVISEEYAKKLSEYYVAVPLRKEFEEKLLALNK